LTQETVIQAFKSFNFQDALGNELTICVWVTRREISARPLAPGIDFASVHLNVDQWLCTERGKDAEGRHGFIEVGRNRLTSRQVDPRLTPG